MRSLIRYAPGLYLLSGLLASTLFYLLPLVPGLITRRFFDQLSGDAPATFDEWTLGALLLTWGLVRFAQLTGATAAEVTLNQTHAALLRANMLLPVLERPADGAAGLPGTPGEAISRFRDDVTSVAGFMSWTLDPIGQSLMYATTLVVLVRIDARLTLAVFLPLGLMLVVVRLATARIQRYRREYQESIGNVTGLLGELFGAVLALKVAGAERHIVERLKARSEVRRRATLRDVLFTQLLGSVSSNTASLATGVILLVAGQSLRQGTLTVGDFALFLSYLGWLTQMTGFFGSFVTKIRQVGVSFDRAARLPGSPALLVQHRPVPLRGPLPDLSVPQRTPATRLRTLEVRGLTFLHPDSGRGIRDVDLTLRPGTLTVVTGPVGAGKTTLLRALLGLLPPQAGEVLWNGERVGDPAAFLVPPRAAYTPQAPRLFGESLRDNLLLGLPEGAVDLSAAVRDAVLERDVAALPAGLDTPVGPRGVRLSGGQVQRAAAARMLVRTPDLLVVDDLSSALDVETEAALWARLLDAPREDGARTILAVSHRRAALRHAGHVVLLEGGRVAAQGPPAALRHLWRSDRQEGDTLEGDAPGAAR